ncbi:MAG: PHP domain-containing protein [Eubacterium sp.]|nr:PHP domain-containing protein [Eubacterium sp.]
MEKELDKYRMTFDIHTHTIYSHGFIRPHGKGTIEQNVQAAIAAGLEEIAISDHGPGHHFYGLSMQKVPEMRAEIERLQEKYPEIRISLSVEANVVDNGGNCLDVKPSEMGEFDFVLAGYHYGASHGRTIANMLDHKGLVPGSICAWLEKKNTEMTIGALRQNRLKVLTHPGDKARFDIERIARVCAETGTWMEISTWHKHLTVEEIRIAMKEDVSFIISSDAHTPDRVGSFRGGLVRAFEAGLPIERIVNVERI